MKRMNRRGQFFLLAAVIISVVVISMGADINRAIVDDTPDNFHDFSYEVQREVGSVLDYDVYSGFDSDADLDRFIELLAADIQNRALGSEFIFIYGNKDELKLANYGTNSIYFDDLKVAGSPEGLGTICYGGTCDTLNRDYFDSGEPKVIHPENNEVVVEVEGDEYTFPLTKYKQVIFIMQKVVGGDKHVVVK